MYLIIINKIIFAYNKSLIIFANIFIINIDILKS